MQLQRPNNVAGVMRLVLAALIVVASAIATVPKAHSQQDVDPTWYDYQPEAGKTTRHSTPTAIGKLKLRKNGSALRHQASNKTRAKKQTFDDGPHVRTASVK